jgi:hypothetical protein
MALVLAGKLTTSPLDFLGPTAQFPISTMQYLVMGHILWLPSLQYTATSQRTQHETIVLLPYSPSASVVPLTSTT